MASITTDPRGNRAIQFVDLDGKRRTIRLGKLSAEKAQTVKLKIEDLAAAKATGHAPKRETTVWLTGVGDVLRGRLAGVGLIEKVSSTTLAGFVDEYIRQRVDVKGTTAIVYLRVRRYLVDHFGPDRALRSIRSGDAEEWRLHLIGSGKAENTVRRSVGVAKQWFRAAVRRRFIDENPFADLTSAVKSNQARYHFITPADAEKVLQACPNAEWRLMFALARYGGLRVPSEILRLRWCDVDWDKGRFIVHSPKTEHHEGGASRIVPIFPELRTYLLEAFDAAEAGAEYVVTRYRDAGVNLRTTLEKIISRAGLKSWPKLWQNLRSSRQTELMERFPAHVVCDWIGNSAAVALKHYLQVTDSHFDTAIAGKALHNPVQQPGAGKCEQMQGEQPTSQKPLEKQSRAKARNPLQSQRVGGSGRYWTRTSDLTGVIRAF
jgi:integrase